MRFKCESCSFELNLNIKSLPKNARLFCPKCKAVLTNVEDRPLPTTSSEQITDVSQRMEPEQTAHQVSAKTPPETTKGDNYSPEMTQKSNSSEYLFNEDIKPEFEMQSEEIIQKTREELFSKPEQVWYDSTVQPPPTPPQTIVPPPIPTNTVYTSGSIPPPIPQNIPPFITQTTPPPIPQNIPPPIPSSVPVPQVGYISASSSIQIDSSLIMPDTPKAAPSAQPISQEPPSILEEKIELSTEVATTPPTTTPPVEEAITQKEDKVKKTKDRDDVILLAPQTHPTKRISITLPAISLIVLACIAGFIYYQIVVSSSKTELIKDLKSTPSLGSIPPPTQTKQTRPESSASNPQETQSNSTSKNAKIPIKAKRSALEHYKKGNQYFMETKYEQARDEYAMAIAADPTFGLAYRGLGTTYAKLGQPDLAVKNYEKYIELMPNATDVEQVKSIIKQYYGK